MLNIHESAEDYLETILMLRNEKGYARSVDIAAKLGVTKPSVSFAMKRLRENEYIQMDEESLISLLPKGEEIARRILERHVTISTFLMNLGVPHDIALEDACKVEHDISVETFDAIKKQLAAQTQQFAETAANEEEQQ